jgi:N-acetylglutamate synthase-like GNAT family acetyltransferase
MNDSSIIGGRGFDLPTNQHHGMLSWYFVHPNVCGNGVGNALVKQNMASISMSENINKLIVRTSQFAFPFFEKHGFKTVEVKIDYCAKGYDLYFMQMDI